MIKIQLEQGPSREEPAGVTAAQALKDLGVAKDRQVVAAAVDGELLDLSHPLERDCTVAPCAWIPPRGWRSCAIAPRT